MQNLSEILLLVQNPIDTYFNPRTPLAIAERFRKDGAKVLREALSTWKPWIPPGELVFAALQYTHKRGIANGCVVQEASSQSCIC